VLPDCQETRYSPGAVQWVLVRAGGICAGRRSMAPYHVVYYHHAEDPPGLVRLKIGDVDMLRVVDEHGMLKEERLQLPGHRFRVSRELRKGTIR
jgi:hypothetical protein